MKVVIIGGGFVGVACYHALQAAGAEALIIDPAPWWAAVKPRENSGSAASRGWFLEEFLQGDYFETLRPAWWSHLHSEAALDQLPGFGASGGPIRLITGETWERSWQDDGARLLPGGWRGPDPIPDFIPGEVERILLGEAAGPPYGRQHVIRYDGGKEVEADFIVMAAGHWNSALIRDTFGGPPLETSAVRGHFLRFPTEVLDAPARFILPGGQFWAFMDGFTLEIGPVWEEAPDQTGAGARAAAIAAARHLDEDAVRFHPNQITGYRERGPGGKLYVEEVAERVIAVGGTDRMGMGVAGGLAYEVRRRIG